MTSTGSHLSRVVRSSVNFNLKTLIFDDFLIFIALLDLLAVTTTSVSCTLSFEYSLETTETPIINFLTQNFGFRNIFNESNLSTHEKHLFTFSEAPSSIKESSLLYQDDGFLKGTVIRIQKSSLKNFITKIYTSDDSRLISLTKSFVIEFEDNCKISLLETPLMKEKLVAELKYSLLEEISHLKTPITEDFVKEQCRLESRSDKVFLELCSLMSQEEGEKKTGNNDVKD